MSSLRSCPVVNNNASSAYLQYLNVHYVISKMATKTWLRLYSSILHVRVTFGLTDALNAGRGLLVPRALHRWSANVPRRRKKSDEPQFVNRAALERGTTKYFCNRNPRSLELLGLAEKPRGFATKKIRVDYYHRCVVRIHCYS